MPPSHNDSWTVPATANYVAKCGAGGASGHRGQTGYRGGGGGGGATSSKEFSETIGEVIALLIPDNGVHNTLDSGSDAVYANGRGGGRTCIAAGGKAPGFFGPQGLGGKVADCTGDVKVAGVDGDGTGGDFTVGVGHDGGASADGTIGAPGGALNDASGGVDGIAPGGGGSGGGSNVGGITQHSAASAGYIQIWRKVDWPAYPSGNPTTLPIATFGTPPPPVPSSRRAFAPSIMGFLFVIVLSGMLSGCFGDSFYKKGPSGSPSPAAQVQAVARAVAPGWGDVVALGIAGVGTLFGLGTHIHHRKKTKKLAKENAELKSGRGA